MKFRLTIVCIFVSLTMAAQQSGRYIAAGDQAFAEGDYYAASYYFKKAKENGAEGADVLFKYAEACRAFNDYTNAASAYEEVLKAKEAAAFPLAQFWLGEMLKCQGKYTEAIKRFDAFRKKYRKQDYYAAKAAQQIESCSWAKENFKENAAEKVIRLDDAVNTEMTELNPLLLPDDSLWFTSLRNIGTDKNTNYRMRLYERGGRMVSYPSAGPEMNLGNAALSPDGSKIYFTLCESAGRSSARCDIYEAPFANHTIGTARKLNENINKPGTTSTHPAIGKEGTQTVLFFSSDRSGGEGKMDLWRSVLSANGEWGVPNNLGKIINTAGDEITPFFDQREAVLYFSSDWHYGYGGYDVFASRFENGQWQKPKNFCGCVNSPANDVYFTQSADGSKMLFSSNRTGSKFIAAETCCNDLYMIETGEKKVVVAAEPKPVVTAQPTPAAIEEQPVVSRTEITRVSPVPETVIPAEPEKKIQQLIPVVLYFHNDEPECCNLRDTTSLNYLTTYESYSALLRQYKKEFARGLSEGKKADAEQAIFYLFTNRVDKGHRDLVSFTSYLLDILKGGKKVEVTLKGYCSPLNYNQYNIHLGNRRTTSVKNYFTEYLDGVFVPYLQSGQLVVKTISLGEETASTTVSDKREDTRNSVYNPDAAIERRAEIIAVEVK